jgi:Na+/H+ antiporter NhaB
MTWGMWLKGLISAAIGAAANSITVMIVDPINFNLSQNASKVGWVALVSAIVAVAMYLKSSPLPNGGQK